MDNQKCILKHHPNNFTFHNKMIAILTIFYEKVRDIAKCITNNEDIDIEQKITDVSNVIREEYYSYQHRDLESAQQTQENQAQDQAQDQDLERALDPDHHIITIRDEDESSSQDELYFNPATISRGQHEVHRCTFFELHKPASSLEEANKSIDTLYNILDNEIEAHETTAYRMKLLWNQLYGTDQNV